MINESIINSYFYYIGHEKLIDFEQCVYESPTRCN